PSSWQTAVTLPLVATVRPSNAAGFFAMSARATSGDVIRSPSASVACVTRGAELDAADPVDDAAAPAPFESPGARAQPAPTLARLAATAVTAKKVKPVFMLGRSERSSRS